MTHHPDIDDLKRHLLGKTGGRTEKELDLAILRNDGSLDPYLSAAIGEIYDDIVSGVLSKRDQRRFLERFPQTPECAAQLRIARSFRDYANGLDRATAAAKTRKQTESFVSRMIDALGLRPAPAWKYAFATVLLASVSLNVWFSAGSRGVGVTVADTLTLRPASMIQVARPGSEEIAVDATHGLVLLQLDIGSQEHQTYEVTIARDGAGPLWTHRELRAEETGRTTVVKVLIPSEILETGHYTAFLGGISPDGRRDKVDSFSFSVN